MSPELLQKLRDRLVHSRRRLGPLTRIGTDQPYAMRDALIVRELTEVISVVEEILENVR